MKVSVLSVGHMAGKMVRTTLSKMDDIELFGVAAREPERAREFAMTWGFKRFYNSYEDLARDPETELVYIATPNSLHYEHAKMCLENGRHVLLEKPFTVHASQARELIALSEQKNLLLAEAIWTRYMPSRWIISDLIASGAIGTVTSLTANLGYSMMHKTRLLDPGLGGGALLDVGVYPLNFALMAIPGRISELKSYAVKTKNVAKTDFFEQQPLQDFTGTKQEFSPAPSAAQISCEAAMRQKNRRGADSPAGGEFYNNIGAGSGGVDLSNTTIIRFDSGVTATLNSSMMHLLDSEGNIYGEKGFLQVQNVNNPEEIRQYDNNYNLVARHQVPEKISGYEYEVRACMRAIAEGRIECPEMPHSETLRVMRLLDRIREQW